MGKIKTYSEFMFISEDKSGTNYEYGCLMLNLNFPNWKIFTSNIDKDDLYDSESERYGIETEPHVTILYGIHKSVDDDVVYALFSDLKKNDFDLKVSGIDCFFNKDYDVLKMNILSDKLSELNKLAKRLPHTSDYPDYKPHITIAYLQKGKASQYANPNFNINLDNINKIVYSKSNGQKISIPVI